MNPILLHPQIKHVTNIQKDIYVKLYGVKKPSLSGKGPGYFESSYKVIQIPKLNSEFQTKPKLQVVSRSKSVKEGNSQELYHRTSTPAYDLAGPRLSREFSKPVADDDSDNLSDQQKDILNDLDNTLNGYQADDKDDMPKIIADVLPFGEFEPFNMDAVFTSDSGVDSDGPSSRTSSISDKSVSSRSGIISKRASTESAKRKVNSVSFQLPEGHKDKPYSPMQNSQKQKPSSNTAHDGNTFSYTVTASNGSAWHDNESARRNSSGPFKGSFMKLFYKKYGETNVGNYGNHARYLTPKIMEKVESFESLKPSDIADTAHFRAYSAHPAIVRRHTFR